MGPAANPSRGFEGFFYGATGNSLIIHDKAQGLLDDEIDLLTLRSSTDSDPLWCLIRDE